MFFHNKTNINNNLPRATQPKNIIRSHEKGYNKKNKESYLSNNDESQSTLYLGIMYSKVRCNQNTPYLSLRILASNCHFV